MVPSSLMADVLLCFSPLRPACTRRLSPAPNPPRLNLSRRLRLLAASFPSTHHQKRLFDVKVHAVVAETDGPKWWEKNAGSNMIDVHSTEEFLNALSQAADKLVIVEFYGTWCGSCRALFPKLCRTAREHTGILFIKVNFDENKPMCKRLNVRVLPYFHFYRGADGLLESFSCSLAKVYHSSFLPSIKIGGPLLRGIAIGLLNILHSILIRSHLLLFQKIKDAITMHNTDRCSIGPPLGVGDLNLLDASIPQGKPAEASPSSPNLTR